MSVVKRIGVYKRSLSNGWIEGGIAGLDIVVEAENEARFLEEIEHALTAEYHLAVSHERKPFQSLAIPVDWENPVTFEMVRLIDEVWNAISESAPNVLTLEVIVRPLLKG